MSEVPVPMHDHVVAAMETEKSLPPHLRLVTNLTRRKQWVNGDGSRKTTSLGFLRKVESLLPDAAKQDIGE